MLIELRLRVRLKLGSTGDSPVVSGDPPETLPAPRLPTFSPIFNHTHGPP
jgi:hypothetical protein